MIPRGKQDRHVTRSSCNETDMKYQYNNPVVVSNEVQLLRYCT